MPKQFRLPSSPLWAGGLVVLGMLAVGPVVHTPSLAAQEENGSLHIFAVRAHQYTFDPPTIEVFQGDQVRVTLRAEDIAHSFTIDAYRISKRAAPGQTVTFEFRADTPGRFTYYCELRADNGCRQMKGELVVRAR